MGAFLSQVWSEIADFFIYCGKILPALLGGAGATLSLFIVCIILSLPLGFLITLMTKSKLKFFRGFANIYIFILRGTPLLLQLLFVYFGLPNMPLIGKYLILDRFPSACVAFVLNYAAYFAEIFRGGLLSIDKGQYEACQVLGLSKSQTTMKVIIPQMLRVALPSISNETITLIKDTSLLYAIAVPEILHFAKVAVSRDFRITAFVLAAVIYLVFTFILTIAFKKLEKKYKHGSDSK